MLMYFYSKNSKSVMSDKTQTEEEPSIEEILDSIRQIISEDDDDGEETEAAVAAEDAEQVDDSPMDQSAIDDMDFDAPSVAEPSEPLDQSAIDDMDFDAPASVTEPEDDTLVLTDKIATGDGELEIDMVDDPEMGDDFGLDDKSDTEPEPEAHVEPDASVEVETEILEELEPVVEDVSVEAEEVASEPDDVVPEPADDILTDQAKEAAFTAMSELVRKTAVNNASSLTLEDIVRSELKPLLRAWLDQHLPTVIDRLVREELERVSKRVLED